MSRPPDGAGDDRTAVDVGRGLLVGPSIQYEPACLCRRSHQRIDGSRESQDSPQEVMAATERGPLVRQEGLAFSVSEAAQHSAGDHDSSWGAGQRERLRSLVVEHDAPFEGSTGQLPSFPRIGLGRSRLA
ncbi:hypothetical protein QFZ32_000369 [Streptomyces canus]|nr:hypothetical protein [Streptomyces canus]MDQ1064930.1 hypothetical protein [Streptomyces canus]